MARAFVPEVALLDLGLPGGLSGYDLAPRLRSLPGLGDVLLVALTGHGQEEDRRRRALAFHALDERGQLVSFEGWQLDPERWSWRVDHGRKRALERVFARQLVRLIGRDQADPGRPPDPGEKRGKRPGRAVRTV